MTVMVEREGKHLGAMTLDTALRTANLNMAFLPMGRAAVAERGRWNVRHTDGTRWVFTAAEMNA